MRKRVTITALWSTCLLMGLPAPAATWHMDLQGDWAFALDPKDVGVQQQWCDRALAERIRLPASLQQRGFGDAPDVDSPWTGNVRADQWELPKYAPYRKPGNFKMPFWLQPDKVYVGPAWYQRDVSIDPSWTGQRVMLYLERCHWFTRVWVDDREVGQQDSLSTPHAYDVTPMLSPGRHRLTIRVDNRVHVGVGVNSHSVSDHTQTNWNGIVGQLELHTTPTVFIDDVQVYPDVEKKAARIVTTIGRVHVKGSADDPLVAKVTYHATCGDHASDAVTQDYQIPPEGKKVEFTLPLGDPAKLWDEFHPNVYHLSVNLKTAAGVHTRQVAFGLREIEVREKRFLLNGQPIMFRGTLECCIFPLTGYPPTDVESWKRVVRICQAHGLNHMRFHSHCPPEAAFVAADELGFYFQVECGSWANQGSQLGVGHPIDAWIYAEAERIRRAYGNHPSFLLMAYGNEPAGPERGGKFLRPWVEHQKKVDSRRLYTSAAGWPMISANQYHNTPQPRIQAWGGGLRSRINGRPPETTTDYRGFVQQQDVPAISHEIGQWCVYPNFDEMAKYTGVLKPRNFEVFRDFLRAKQLDDQARGFLMASGKLQTLCYKEEIESALRTPGFGGFQLLDLHDFPGQGTALVGVLDPFWDSKPYVSPAEFRRFCGQTVPLARVAKRTWTTAETFVADVEVSHFGAEPLKAITSRWGLAKGPNVVASGTFPARDLAIGGVQQLGRIELPLSAFDQPAKLTLTVTLDGTEFANDWDLWVYPAKVDPTVPHDVMLVNQLGHAAMTQLKQGGKVLLLANPTTVKGDVAVGFSSIFWNTAWTGGQAPHTLGILCDPQHPALAQFPTEYHTNWQWWELISRSGAMVMDSFPTGVRPLVQIVPDWFEPQRLGLVFEAIVAGGKLMVCSIDLEADLSTRPVARQMRASLLRYMASDEFAPEHTLTPASVRGLFRELPTVQQLKAQATADSQQPGHEAARAIDGNPQTIWHTAWEPDVAEAPHWLAIDLQNSVRLVGMECLPRADQANGRIGTFEVYVSDDARNWGTPVATGAWTDNSQLKTLRFDRRVTGRYVKLVALREVNGRPWASLAEIEVIVDEND